MDDGIDVVLGDDRADQFLVADIADKQQRVGRQRGTEAGRQVVQHDHWLAGVGQRVNHVAADIPGAAGDQNGHLIVPLANGPQALGKLGEGQVSQEIVWRLCLTPRI